MLHPTMSLVEIPPLSYCFCRHSEVLRQGWGRLRVGASHQCSSLRNRSPEALNELDSNITVITSLDEHVMAASKSMALQMDSSNRPIGS